MLKETALFEARRDALASEVALMRTLRGRVEQEMAALRAQIAQAQSSLALQTKDLEANRGLLDKGFISPTRLGQIEATVVDYASKLEERRSELARAAQRLVDSDLKMKSLQNQYMQAASDQLKVTAARLAEIEQEQRKSEDAAARQVVAAPASGEVIDLKFTSPGAVVRPGEPIAEIVPSDAKLMIEAQIRPEEINHVYLDQRARIKFTSFRYRNSAMVTGKVTYVSADRLDRPGDQPAVLRRDHRRRPRFAPGRRRSEAPGGHAGRGLHRRHEPDRAAVSDGADHIDGTQGGKADVSSGRR